MADFWPCSLLPGACFLRPDNHHLGGFDEGGGSIALLEGELAGGVGGDDGGNALVAGGEDDFGEEALNLDLRDGADELVPAADARGDGLGSGEEFGESAGGDAMVTAWGFDGLDAAGEDPVFEGGIAHAEPFGGLTRGEECRNGHARTPF